MDQKTALSAFSALSQDIRLAAFRRLVEAGPEGMAAGGLAEALGARQNTLSSHLGQLVQAGLVTNRREGRVIRYFARIEAAQALAVFLTETCCGGQPELCAPDPQARMEGFLMTERKNVLFLCSGNSARSLMAEVILNAEAGDRFRAYSAGSDPRGGPHPYTLELLRNLGHDVSGLRSKSWGEFEGAEAPRMDFVFTVCDRAASEPCPVWPGQPISAHWGLPDPVIATGNEAERRLAFVESYRMLRNRLTAFASLPMESLGWLSLKREVDAIGKMGSETPA